jgi:hypothetical protein
MDRFIILIIGDNTTKIPHQIANLLFRKISILDDAKWPISKGEKEVCREYCHSPIL